MIDSSEIDETLEVASKTWTRVIETANKVIIFISSIIL